jgi:serine/threonine-protein kinase
MADGDARIGTMLKGKWRIDALLGAGGTAIVYAATHRNGKRVALKILRSELALAPGLRERFVREGYVANRIGRGAVAVDDDDVTDDGAAFLVMELLDGETLEARRQRSAGGRLPVAEVLGAMDQVLATLASAHAQGIVHRDLKPDNVFLTQGGVVKLLDFGIARLRDGNVADDGTTVTGMLMGTAAYMPPEQARGRWTEVDARSDLWAVGATMFTLLAGRCVHGSGTVPEVLVRAVTEPAPDLRIVAPHVPARLAAIVERALQRDKNLRWQDAISMQTALRQAAALGDDRDESDTPSDRELTTVFRRAPASSTLEDGTTVSALARTALASPTLASAAATPPALRQIQLTTAPVASRTLLPRPRPGDRAWKTPALVALAGLVGLSAWWIRPRAPAPSAPAPAAEAAPPAEPGPTVEPASSASPEAEGAVPATTPEAKPIPGPDLPDVTPSPKSPAAPASVKRPFSIQTAREAHKAPERYAGPAKAKRPYRPDRP